jgi:hypothetical protein
MSGNAGAGEGTNPLRKFKLVLLGEQSGNIKLNKSFFNTKLIYLYSW